MFFPAYATLFVLPPSVVCLSLTPIHSSIHIHRHCTVMVFQGDIQENIFGEVDGVCIKQITITTPSITLGVITWGATITRLEVPDRKGKKGNVVLGFDNMEGYTAHTNR